MMLETIKEYAAERLDELPDFAAAARHAHAAYFADFAKRQWQDLTGQRREAALAAMTADIDNLRLAWRYWVAKRDRVQLNKLVDSLWLLYDAGVGTRRRSGSQMICWTSCRRRRQPRTGRRRRSRCGRAWPGR